MPIEQVKARDGTHATPDDYDVLIHGDCKVFAPDGSLVCALVRGGMDADLAAAAYPALHHLRRYKSDNRANYSGQATTSDNALRETASGQTPGMRSKSVASAVIGYFDRYPRIPFCRQTAFTAKEPEKWATVVPLIKQVSGLFKATVPGRYKVQRKYVDSVHPDFVIGGTVFTTLTVNNCVAAAYHQDSGDYKPGFGVLSCLRRGEYAGFQLCFPRYRVAVDLQDRDVLFFDPHEWHSNVQGVGIGPEAKPDAGGWERISMVMYVRAKMANCGSAAQEAELAKRRQLGTGLKDRNA